MPTLPRTTRMRFRPALLATLLLTSATASADTAPKITRVAPSLTVMTPSPTQAPPPGLRLRTMVRPADRLWIGVDIPAEVPPQIGNTTLDLLDRIPSGGWVATYREPFEACARRPPNANCHTTVRILVPGQPERTRTLHTLHSRPDRIEVQDVRYAEDGDGPALYYNEACQSYSKEAGGKCSALVAVDPVSGRVRWRTGPLVSNNHFVVVGKYIVAAYGFTSEPATIRVVRRSDGKVMSTRALAGTNFEMSRRGDVLSVEMYHRIGRGNFRLVGFDGDSPQLEPLATTPPDPNQKPIPYNPPLISWPKVDVGDDFFGARQ